MRIALFQINPTVNDIAGNCELVRQCLRNAERQNIDLAVFPEQTILGYPAGDLLLRPDVIRANVAALTTLAQQTKGPAAIVGFAQPNDSPTGRPAYNAAALLADGRVHHVIRKRLLPTYDVFDESRYFEPADAQPIVEFRGTRLGITICEDMWSREELLARPLYDVDPLADLAAAGAELLINISASPYFLGKQDIRRALLTDHAGRHRRPLLFVNQVGANDELIFDGASAVVGADGRVLLQGRAFEEDCLIFDTAAPPRDPPIELPRRPQILHDALVLGLRDYVRKCNFRSVVLGLSGGIDSAVVAALAVAALGPDRVHGVAMPSRFSSDHSLADARALAANLGIRFSTIPIDPIHRAFETQLAPEFAGRAPDVTEENIQARVRGALLMSLSNKFGSLLLTTGNKSELAVGYCTLYGDMCGGLAVISDVPKTLVYDVARYINTRSARELIPQNTIDKAPSAELRPNQTDQDTLPPYPILDEIIERYEVRSQSADEIIAAGFDPTVVRDTLRRIHLNEYKRRQAAPGLKVTPRAFGLGRRMPIAAKLSTNLT